MLPVLLSLAAAARGEDWPAWRGPTGMGLSADKELPLHWDGRTGHHVLWKAPLPGHDGGARPDQNQSSPIAWRDRVILTLAYWPKGVSPPAYPEQHVLCFRAADGKLFWDTRVEPGPWKLTDLRGGYAAPTPATDGERVFVLFGSAVLAALDLNGKLLWHKPINPHTFDVAIGTSPVLYKDTVLLLCAMANRQDSRLVAFAKATGTAKWVRQRPDMAFGHSTPLLIHPGGKAQLVLLASGMAEAPAGFLAVDPEDGRPVWWCKAAGDASSPVYGSGIVYGDSGRGSPGTAVAPDGRGDVTRTRIRWTVPRVPQAISSPLILDGLVYRVHDPGILKVWRAATGEQVHAGRLKDVSTWSSPFADGTGHVYLANAGKTYVLKAGPKPKVLAVNDLGDPSPASAAVAGGRIYLKGGRFLYCVGK